MHSTLPFSMRDARAFESFVARAVLWSAIGGVAHVAFGGFNAGVSVLLFATPAVVLCAQNLSWGARAGLGAALGLVVLTALFALRPLPGLVLIGTFTGLALFAGRLTSTEETTPPTIAHAVAAAGAGAVVLPVTGWALRSLWAVRLGVLDPVYDLVLVGAGGLLLAVIALPLHVHPASDLLLEQGEAAVRSLRGRFRTIGERVLDHYRECRALLAALPRDKALMELEATFAEVMTSTLEHLRAWSGVEEDLAEAAAAPDARELERLRAELESTHDPVARQHLEVAVSMQEEELARLEVLATSRKRAIARLEAQSALLGRVKGALLGVKSGHAEVRAVELTSLARKLSAQSASQSLEGELMREVASGAELDQLAAGVR